MNPFTRAAELGLETEFIDGQGHRRVTDAAALEVILDALPARTGSRFVDGPVVVRSGQPAQTVLSEAATLPAEWKLVADLKVIAQGEARNRTIVWPSGLPVGTYRLHLTNAASSSEEVAF